MSTEKAARSAARALQRETGMKYTQALRQVQAEHAEREAARYAADVAALDAPLGDEEDEA